MTATDIAVSASKLAELFPLTHFLRSQGADYATMAVGFRSRLSSQTDIGFAYEFPLTNEEDNFTKDRFTFDLTYKF